ncbi:MAG: aminodeoxychorismate synthase component I [Campylobacterales bacterium]
MLFFIWDFDRRFEMIPVQQLEEQGIYLQTPLYSTSPPPGGVPSTPPKILKYPIGYPLYLERFNRVQLGLRKGETYLLNLTFPTVVESDYSPLEIYNRVSAPFKLYFRGEFLCYSPERFVKVVGNKIFTYPMKGTIDGQIPNAEELILGNQKEMAEHLMVVDLLRNDLGIIGRRIRINRFRYIDKIFGGRSPLLQVSSEIEGELPENWLNQWEELIGRLLPAGSISGTPKKRTCEIIREVEGYRRGYYTGIFGILDRKRKILDSGVIIRYLEPLTPRRWGEVNHLFPKLPPQKLPFRYLYKSGGGITIDSNPEEEYRELLRKVYF